MARRKNNGGCLSSVLFLFFIIYIISQIDTIPNDYKIVIGQAIILILIAIVIYYIIQIIRKIINKKEHNNYYSYKQKSDYDEYNPNKIIVKNVEQLKEIAVEFTHDEQPVKRSVVNYDLPNMKDFVKDKDNVELIQKEDNLLSIVVENNSKKEVLNLSSCSNLLIYGLIESGKSSITHSLIKNIVLNKKHDEVRLGIIDTKKLEYNNYNNIPHLICPLINDPKKAMIALESLYREIKQRLDILASYGVKNIKEYNKKIASSDSELVSLPYMVFIIDELNDLLISDKKEFTEIIKNILTDSRLVGVYIICNINTLNQSVIDNNFVGLFSSVLSFRTSSVRDSKLLFDNGELNQLGDFEFRFKNKGIKSLYKYKLVDVISDDVIDYYKSVDYIYERTVKSSEGYEDPLMNEIIDFAVESGKISASLIQRRFRLGYNRAARIIDELEARGIIGPQNGSKPREVLVKVQGDE